jgi:hypothetical protein
MKTVLFWNYCKPELLSNCSTKILKEPSYKMPQELSNFDLRIFLYTAVYNNNLISNDITLNDQRCRPVSICDTNQAHFHSLICTSWTFLVGMDHLVRCDNKLARYYSYNYNKTFLVGMELVRWDTNQAHYHSLKHLKPFLSGAGSPCTLW